MKNLITFGNSKLKKDGIGVFKLPAKTTCPFAGECADWCYAKLGTYNFPAVKGVMERSFEASRKDNFVERMVNEVRKWHGKGKLNILRIHSSGDFYNQEYYNKWVEISNQVPEVTFYAYTKSFPYIDYDNLPDNLIIIQSSGGRLPVDESKKHARVFPTREKAEEMGYVVANDSDLIALEHDKIGIVAHGQKKKLVTEVI